MAKSWKDMNAERRESSKARDCERREARKAKQFDREWVFSSEESK
jgi:hypothetical protein